MFKEVLRYIIPTFCSLLLTSCSYNPFSGNNHLTGSAESTMVGAAAGGLGAAAAGGNKPVYGIGILGGAAIGYYVSTLRYDAGGVYAGSGKVYTMGQYVGIYIPTDKLFEPNSDEFLPQASSILDSAATILQRFPDNNILISGNTSGFGRRKWEQRLSERRAEKIAAYFWNEGINYFKEPGNDMRKLRYVGYGDFFPLASNQSNNGIRENSRIQITSYPSNADLHLDGRHLALHNVGAYKDERNDMKEDDHTCPNGQKECYESNNEI